MVAKWDWFSVFLYCFIALIGVFCLARGRKSKSARTKKRYYSIWFITWVLFASFRMYGYKFGGTDTLKYVNFFENLFSSQLSAYYRHYDIGYWALNYAVRVFTSNVRIYFIVYYSILMYSYIRFIDEFISCKTSFIPFLLIFFLYLRGFTSLRTNISVAFLLLALVSIKNRKMISSIILLIVSCLMHKATILYAGVAAFYWINERKPIKVKTSILFAFLASGVGLVVRRYIGDFFDSSVDAYGAYAFRTEGVSFFTSFWKIVFSQLVLLALMIVFNKKILYSIGHLDDEYKNRLHMIRTFCIYDFITIPITFTLSIWRGPEYLYLVRLIMWGSIIEMIIKSYIAKKDWRKIQPIIFLVFIAWFIFRLEATWEASSLLPYVFSIV